MKKIVLVIGFLGIFHTLIAQESKNIPATLNDCYLMLDSVLNNEQKNEIKNTNERDLIMYHRGLGMWIRNNFGLWSNRNVGIRALFIENNILHPDSMSQLIIVGYFYYLNGINKSIEELIELRYN